jgi:YD repeat-containing protein
LQGQTATVKDGNGNTTSYAYDKDGNLLSATAPLGITTKSAYDRADRLIQTVDANGKAVNYSYDAANRLLSRTVDPGGLNLVTSFSYNAKGQQITTTDPAGVVTQFVYDLKGQLSSVAVDPTGLNAITRYTYDGRGKQLTVTSPGGAVTQYVYDALGRRTEEHTDPAGLNLVRRYTYDKDSNVVAVTDANGNVTRYAYDADNRLVYTVSPTGSVQKNAYDAKGRLTSTIAYAAPMALTGLGNVLTVAQIAAAVAVTAGQDAVQYSVYDKNDRLRYTVNGLGDVTSYAYDSNGNVIDTIRYAKRITLTSWTPGSTPPVVADAAHDSRLRTVYDALNRAVFSLDGVGAVTAVKYDNNGNVIDKVSYAKAIPISTAMTSAAISAAVATVANASTDRHLSAVYDAANRVTYSMDGVGAVTQNLYDKDGRLVKQVSYATAVAAGGAPGSVVASGNDRVSLFAYDNAGHLAYQVNTLGAVVRTVYDANGNVIQRIAYSKAIAAPTTTSAAPTVASLAAAVVADAANDRSSFQTYDAAGRLVFSIDNLGGVSEMRYDALGHVTARVNYANAIAMPLAAGFNTTSVRALLKADASRDQLSQRAYDTAGRLVYTVDALGFVHRNTYDGLGRVTAATVYAKAIATTTANTVAAIAAAVVADAADETTQYRYDNAGEQLATIDALGRSETYTYDGLGNRLSLTNKAGATWTYSYDAAGNLLTEVAPPVSVSRVGTDANGNLVAGAATANVYITTAMTYDALGNVRTRTEAAGQPEQRTTVYVYDALGRQTMTIFPPVAIYNAADNPLTNGATGPATRSETTVALQTQTFYDTLGNAYANRDVSGNYSYKSYDRLGQVVYDIDALGFVTGYQRNSFGDVATLTRYAQAPALALSTAPRGRRKKWPARWPRCRTRPTAAWSIPTTSWAAC